MWGEVCSYLRFSSRRSWHQLHVFARRRDRGLARAAAQHYDVLTLSNFRTDGFREWFGGDAFVPSGAVTTHDPNAGDDSEGKRLRPRLRCRAAEHPVEVSLRNLAFVVFGP
jgi:hypothetical protein